MSNYEAHRDDYIKIVVREGSATYKFTIPTMEAKLSSVLEGMAIALQVAGFTYAKELIARNSEDGEISSQDAQYD